MEYISAPLVKQAVPAAVPIFPAGHMDLNESIRSLCTRGLLNMYLLYNTETRTLAYDDLVMIIIIVIAFNHNYIFPKSNMI